MPSQDNKILKELHDLNKKMEKLINYVYVNANLTKQILDFLKKESARAELSKINGGKE